MPRWKFAKRTWLGVLHSALSTLGALWLTPTVHATTINADEASVAWLRDGKVEVHALADPQRSVDDRQVPLGSLWKLFVYAYLAEQKVEEPAFTCGQKTTSNSEERYCCDPGETVGRDSALARSCAPYFAANRLGLTEAGWQGFWQNKTVAPWILQFQRLQPETKVKVSELLQALANVPPSARAAARQALLETSMEGYGREAWTQLGTGTRYKTYSWHVANHLGNQIAYGGAAGWLADGTPFWFGARGASHTALSRWSSQLAQVLPPPRWNNFSNNSNLGDNLSCVDVDFFARYPIREVLVDGKSDLAAKAGKLQGRFRIQFENENWLTIHSNGDLELVRQLGRNGPQAPIIRARLSINDYVARVVDREGSGDQPAAARALAIAARSYLIQNAQFERGCWRIADSSQRQRVSPNPPSPTALNAAWFTDEIILQGVNVHYHQELSGEDRLAWNAALTMAKNGKNFEEILRAAYPKASMTSLAGRADCTPLDDAQKWLSQASNQWQRQLRREPGFESLDTAPRVCSLRQGNPYSDQRRMRIYVRGWRSLNDRITLAHEYLHLALRFHPNGANEDYVEKLARKLIEGQS